MPIKRVAWACKWVCGRNVLTSRKAMEEHENRCGRNPASRACPTCYHACIEYLGDVMIDRGDKQVSIGRARHGCSINKRPESNDGKIFRPMVRNCLFWEFYKNNMI